MAVPAPAPVPVTIACAPQNVTVDLLRTAVIVIDMQTPSARRAPCSIRLGFGGTDDS